MLRERIEFYCPRCNYMTEDKQEIERIKAMAKWYCPACGYGKPKEWHTRKLDKKIRKE